jgi:hypothetical protein
VFFLVTFAPGRHSRARRRIEDEATRAFIDATRILASTLSFHARRERWVRGIRVGFHREDWLLTNCNSLRIDTPTRVERFDRTRREVETRVVFN